MNFKKFLKPDWRKIVVFIIVLFLWLILFTSTIVVFPESFPKLSVRPMHISTGVIVGYPVFLVKLKYVFINNIFYPFYYIWNFSNLLINITVWYLLSCLIIWIYDKVKKKL